jgi:ABC-type transport system involved in cytochrome bd biosynthesis fused ATPase/permease subunit
VRRSLFTSFAQSMNVQDVSYEVADRAKRGSRVTILRHLSGFFNPRELAAIMGPTGSGKSTLLDLLSGRKTIGGAPHSWPAGIGQGCKAHGSFSLDSWL